MLVVVLDVVMVVVVDVVIPLFDLSVPIVAGSPAWVVLFYFAI